MQDFIIIAAGPLTLIHLFYAFAVKAKKLDVIDSAWGLGFIIISLTGCILHQFSNSYENLVFIFVLIWGLRLSGFIFFRNLGKPEDHRYEDMRKGWGKHPNMTAYFKVYLLQYFIMMIVSAPLLVIHFYPQGEFGFLVYPGCALWILGFSWETIADFQKSRFKSQKGNTDKICMEGLWKFSRHPNYFGEAMAWWGICIISATTGTFLGIIGAGLLNFLLVKVSGVPLVEKRHKNKPEWIAYKADTPTLFPSLPKILNSLTN